MAAKRKKIAPDITFTLSYETANALQAILTQQSVHVTRENNKILLQEFDQVNRFYEHLTDYIIQNSR